MPNGKIGTEQSEIPVFREIHITPQICEMISVYIGWASQETIMS